ncbi:hypothetical protein Gohar_000121, partial [Gossypium harknessii]|nr:hypothetical protein [Gossypium harknessii]
SLGHYSVFNAGLLGVLDGLTILQSQKYDGVVIKIDSQEVLQVMEESFSKDFSSAFIGRIHFLKTDLATPTVLREMLVECLLRDNNTKIKAVAPLQRSMNKHYLFLSPERLKNLEKKRRVLRATENQCE